MPKRLSRWIAIVAVPVWSAGLALADARTAAADVQTDKDPNAGSTPASPAPAAPTGKAGIVLPVVKTDPGAEYPLQAITDKVSAPVTVTVIVTVTVDGAVKDAKVETPMGHGFDEAALTAARGLSFEPATRDGKPIAAKIKHSYAFAPPASRLLGRIASKNTGAAIGAATVSVTAADGSVQTAITDATGHWSLEGLAAGTYHVTVAAPAGAAVPGATESADVTLAPSEEADVVLRLTTPATTAAAPADNDVQEVTVKGDREPREVVKRTLDNRELERIPGTNGDALKSLQNLPGVARPPLLAGLLIVRGSAPQDTSVFVDGTLVPIVYHFGGLSSVVPTEAISKLDFYPGNFSAEYGRAMGGIVDVGIRDPNPDGKLHALAQVDLIDARVLAESGLGHGWSFMVSGRRSYVDTWLGPVLTATGSSVSAAPVYYDYQAVLTKKIDSHSDLRFMFFGSDDRLEIVTKQAAGNDPGVGGDIGDHTAFWRAQVRYRNKISANTELKLTGAFGADILDFTIGDDYLRVHSNPASLRGELTQKIAPGVIANVGVDAIYGPYDVAVRFPALPTPGQPPSGPGLAQTPMTSTSTGSQTRPAFYGEFELTPFKGTRIVPGLRTDYASDTGKWDLAPRINARQELHSSFPKSTIKAGVGVFNQPPQPQETDKVFGQQGLRSNRAIHYDLGFEQEITRPVDVSFDLFYKQLDDLVVQGAANGGTGHVYGAETLLKWKATERFFGWLAYTLSRSTRSDGPGLPEHIFQYDQTHILTVLGSYRIGRGWEIGSRFRLVSGNPYTPNKYGFFDENASSYLPLEGYPQYTSRLPIFHQMDIRVDKHWDFKKWKLSAYLDVQNVYNRANAEAVGYNFNSTRSQITSGLPILPVIGLRGEL